ncbi:hypothetical protein [Ochrobactrum soli]|uniref:Major tropism determinant N-terminal domain-containing protein n=1 Tax=Ochrobactrum soli TaxID=2448455 RepID=A0A849KRJ4_9HYPH|nr:hypothetical protein [[Ochrobactrum] soli]NNU62420.1 hypothetical protein [[Ochrobactrum] soli]
MSTQVQHRRGTAVQHESFTGAMSEITHDTTGNNLRVHDGQKPGGYRTLMEQELGKPSGVATLDETGNVPEEQLLNASTPVVSSYEALKSTPVADKEKVTFLSLAGAEGTFFWKLGDFSAKIDNENYVASDHVAATIGAWVRSSIRAPYVLPSFRGLKISEFLTNNDAWTTHKHVQLQAAIDVLMSDARYTELDLEGRTILVNAPLNFGTGTLGWPAKQITNGFIYASATFPDGGYIFDLRNLTSLSNFKFLNVNMNGQNRAGWLRAPKHYKYLTFESCTLSSPGGSGGSSPGVLGRKVGVYDPDVPEGGSHELGFYNCYMDSNQYGSTKDRIAIYTRNPDVNINNCLGQYFKDFFVGTSGSYQLNGNHIWSTADGSTPCSMVRLLDCTSIAGLQMVGNYVDGVQIILGNELNPTNTISGVSLVCNLFLFGPGLPSDMPFVLIKPQNANTGIMAIDMLGNVYDTNNTSSAFQNIGVDTTTGSINPTAVHRVRLDDVSFSEFLLGKVYRSRGTYNTLFTVGDAGYKNVTFDNQIPPFARIRRVVSAQFARADGT